MKDVSLAGQIDGLIRRALEEDRAAEDITSRLLVDDQLQAEAVIIARQDGVLAGADICRQVFRRLDPAIRGELLISDGQPVKPADEVMRISGRARGIMQAERTALNFLGWLSGIASLTARFVTAIRGTGAVITDTRKTAPSLRALEKYAVRTGGGFNHRMNLADAILIKDNHLAALKRSGLDLPEVVEQARRKAPPGMEIEVEVSSLAEARQAADAGADIVMLDNMDLKQIRQAADELSGRVSLEASGGITIDNVAGIAGTGVDYISIGALTHSARWLDFSLEIQSSPSD